MISSKPNYPQCILISWECNSRYLILPYCDSTLLLEMVLVKYMNNQKLQLNVLSPECFFLLRINICQLHLTNVDLKSTTNGWIRSLNQKQYFQDLQDSEYFSCSMSVNIFDGKGLILEHFMSQYTIKSVCSFNSYQGYWSLIKRL